MSNFRLAAWPVMAALLLAPAIVSCSKEQKSAENTVIPRKDIFGNPARVVPQISPDGTMMSFIAPLDGVLNVWVAPYGKIEEAKAVTHETGRPIRQQSWSANGKYILYINDVGGDENFMLFRADPATGEVKNLTDFRETRVLPIASSWQKPDQMLIALNNEGDHKWHDAYLLDVNTGALTLVHKNTEQYDGYLADDSLTIRFATKSQPNGDEKIFKVDANWNATEFLTIGADDVLTTQVFGMSADGSKVYLVDSRNRDKAALMEMDANTGAVTVLGESGKADVDDAILEPLTGRPLAYAANYIKPEWKAIDPAVQADIDFLNANLKGLWSVASQTKDNNLWLITNDATTAPITYYAYDRGAHKVTKLFSARPNLDNAPLSPMYGVEIKTRDNLTLVAYLTLPLGADPDGDGRPDKPLPAVVNIHGGPWARDVYGYDPESQWLANRGYATLQVNYRGSTGFGKAFVNASNHEWGGKMHDDIMDAVKWLIDNKIAIPEKIAAYGGSYGGYATLVSMTFTPTAFACGVDIVGPSNLTTFFNTIPPYWESFREQFYMRIGDPRTEEGKALLAARSPFFKAGEIVRPLLIAQGANDPRVNKAESDQIVEAMKAHNIPVTYVLYPDEGHGFAREPNRTSFYAISEAFLSQCLGGRFEPVGDDFKGASLQVLEGVDYVPGLKAAIGAM